MALCRTCYGEYTGSQSSCPRCQSDLNGWKEEVAQIGQVLGYAPLRSLLVAFVPVVVVAFLLLQPLHAIRSLLAICLAAIPAFVLYSGRYRLREGRWLRQVKPHPGLSASQIQIAAILLAVVLGVATATVGRIWTEEPLTIAQRVALYVMLGLTCVCFSSGLTLVVVLGYGRRLDDRVPQPIFVDMNRLSVLAIEAARKQLGVKGLETTAIQRAEDGGLRIDVKEKMASSPKAEEEPAAPERARRTWTVVADRWGRLRSVLPGSNSEF